MQYNGNAVSSRILDARTLYAVWAKRDRAFHAVKRRCFRPMALGPAQLPKTLSAYTINCRATAQTRAVGKNGVAQTAQS